MTCRLYRQALFENTKYGASVVINDPSYRSAMPVYENILSDEQIVAVLSYIKNSWPEEQRQWQEEINAGLLLAVLLTASSCSFENTVVASANAQTPAADAALPHMVVYKSPTCGCCKDWVKHVEHAGFSVETVDLDDVIPVKHANGLSDPQLMSCHTAIIDGYVIEGHVPASDIERLLAEKPDVTGLTAPGMPMMSPGMGSDIPRDYDVLAFDKDGRSRVYSSY